MEIPDLMIWVKEEPFIFGQACPAPCTKIGLNVLRKVAEYCREKEGYYPVINLLQWGHISRYKLQLPTDLSWLYLRVFDIISKRFEENPEGKGDEQYPAQHKSLDAWDVQCEEIRLCAVDCFDEMKVDTLQFLVFLYIQHYQRLHKKYSSRPLSSSDEPWPLNGSNNTPGSTPRPVMMNIGNVSNLNSIINGSISGTTKTNVSSNSNGSPHLRKKSVPEQIHVEFLIANLEDIIDLLQLTIKKTASGSSDEDRIPVEIPKALSLILGVASLHPHDKEFHSLDTSFLFIPEVARAVAFDEGTKSLSKSKFVQWVMTNLKLNPWGPTSAPVPQSRADCLIGVWEKSKSYEMNRVYWNTQLYPKSWYLVSSVDNQVFYLDKVQPFSSLKIHRCNNSFIYATGAFSSITVEKCRNSTIFLGPAGKVVRIQECCNVSVTAVGRIFILCDNYKSTFHLLTPCQPVVCGSKTRRISFAPYNSFYPRLLEDMRLVELGVQVQKWNKPIELGQSGLPVQKEQGASNCSLLRAERFSKVIFPFEMVEGSTTRNPMELPQSYAKRLVQLEGKKDVFRREVEALDLTEDQVNQMNAICKARFQKWLKDQGHLHHLKGLRSIQHSIRAGTSIPILDSKAERRKKKSGSGGGNGPGSGSICVISPKTKTLSSGGSWMSRLSSSSLGRPGGVLSDEDDEADDEVFNHSYVDGEDFAMLHSVFSSDGEDNDEFELNNTLEYAQKDGKTNGDECECNNIELDLCHKLQSMCMDDGLFWKPI